MNAPSRDPDREWKTLRLAVMAGDLNDRTAATRAATLASNAQLRRLVACDDPPPAHWVLAARKVSEGAWSTTSHSGP